jgi:hypothetical protein
MLDGSGDQWTGSIHHLVIILPLLLRTTLKSYESFQFMTDSGIEFSLLNSLVTDRRVRDVSSCNSSPFDTHLFSLAFNVSLAFNSLKA